MDGDGLKGLVAVLTAAEPSACDRDGLAELVAVSQRVRSWVDAFDVTLASAAMRLAEQGACEGPSTLLADDGRRAVREAQAVTRRAGACELLPALHGALADGAVSAGHADAVAVVIGELDEQGRADLVELEASVVSAARRTPVEQFAREMRDLGRVLSRDEGVGRHERLRRQRAVRRWVNRSTGMCHTEMVLDPETDARVSAALDYAVAAERAERDDDDRTLDQLTADALVGLITGDRQAGHGGPEVSVLIDLDTLRTGLHDRTVCETGDGLPVPPETVRRLACDANLIPIVLDGDGVVLDVGRACRLATAAQRRALRGMYRSCAHPGCGVRFAECRIHHVIGWTDGGPTDLANLLPLCSTHHHQVHEGGWTLTLEANRVITLRRPDGQLHHHGSSVDVPPRSRAPSDGDRPPDDPRAAPDAESGDTRTDDPNAVSVIEQGGDAVAVRRDAAPASGADLRTTDAVTVASSTSHAGAGRLGARAPAA